MADSFLNKVKQIILDHLDDEKFSVNELSSELGLSRSQTFRKIKSLSNKSVSQFINETRLEEAAKLILNSNLNASEISYKVGFSSPSYFNKCFSKYYGVTPGIYKENKKEISPIKAFDQTSSQSRIKKFQTFFYILGAALLIFGIFSIVKSKSSTKKTNPNAISIAVLYFDDHSPESVIDMNKYSSAVTEAITSKLSNLKNLMVTSRSSVKKYRVSNKSIPEIAKELGVDNILEGSSLKFNDSILITVQLIDKRDVHKWSKTFSDHYNNSFKLLNEVSKYIANRFEIELSTEEEKRINFIPTNNLEALQLFSEGLSFADLVGVENSEVYIFRFVQPGGYTNLMISDSLFRQALIKDSNYAEAMAELAFVLQLGWEKASKKWTDVKFKEIDSLIDRSLAINPNTVRAYTTRGLRQGYNNGNWEKAGEYFKQAIEIKPNDASNQLYYALYFALRKEPDYKKALYHINIAQKLNPHSTTINYDKMVYLLKNDKIKEAEIFYKQNSSFFTEALKSKMQVKLLKAKAKEISQEKKDWTEAVKFYHKEIEKDPKNAEIFLLLAETYDEVLNDAPNFLKYTEKALKLDSIEINFKRAYGFALLKNRKFKESRDFLKRKRKSEAPLFTQNYYEGNYKEAEIYSDKYFYEDNISRASLFAYQNKIKETYQILNKTVLKNYEKAKVFAILKERDSMYYYINKEKDIYNIRHFNSFFEVDPYRKDEQFKALLKKHYLPLTHWNE